MHDLPNLGVEVTLRVRATDRFGIVHAVVDGWINVDTRCEIESKWDGRVVDKFNHNVWTWSGLDPLPDVTCMTCLVLEAR